MYNPPIETIIGEMQTQYEGEILLGTPGRARQLMVEAPAVDVNAAMLHASNKVGIKITLETVVMFAALLKRKIKPEDCGKDVMKKIDSLVDTFKRVAEQEEE